MKSAELISVTSYSSSEDSYYEESDMDINIDDLISSSSSEDIPYRKDEAEVTFNSKIKS